MASQITVNSGSGNITVTTSRAVIGTVANVASANYANFAGEVVDPSQPNITSVGNLTNLNVTGTTTTGNLTVLGNLQVGNLVANTANYANFAGEAFNVSGANVTGAVANATFATTAGSATVANSANAVAGANVSGTVANATYAANANIANIAYSVDVANVSGIGNIATINLDGNVANALLGDGTFGAVELTTANYANFAGDVVNATQSNITQTGNLVSLTVNNGVANTITSRYDPNLIAIPTLSNFPNAVSVVDTPGITGNLANPGVNYVVKGRPGGAAGNSNDVIARTVYGAKATGGNILFAGDTFNTIRSTPNVANAFVAGQVTWRVPSINSNLANPNTATLAQFSFNQLGSFALGPGSPGSLGMGITSYGTQNGMIGNTAPATAISIRRARGNADAALSVEPNDSLGDIIWNATYTANGAVGSQTTRIKAVVDSAYVANSPNVASGLEFTTVDSNNTSYTHRFYANGNVQFNNAVNANVVSTNYLYGDGSNITGVNAVTANYANFAGNAYSVDGANVTGTVANATFALDAGNANIANIAYSVDVANVSGIGNIATINLDGNVANALLGDGTFGPVELDTANYANFAGQVIDNTQSNIRSLGNLLSLTINTGVANSTTIQTSPNLIPYAGQNFYSITNAYGPGGNAAGRSKDAKVLNNYNPFEDIRTEYYGSKNGGNARAAQISVRLDANIGNANTDPLIPGAIQMQVYTPVSNLANANTTTFTSFGVDSTGGFLLLNAPQPNPIFQVFGYGSGTGNTAGQLGMLFNRRSGNSDARGGIVAGDYLGNIEWQGAATATGGFGANATRVKIAPRVDSSYGGPNTGQMPVGLEFRGGTTSNPFVHTMYSNGNVTFNNAVNATVSNATSMTVANGNIQLSNRNITLSGLGEQPPANSVFSSLSIQNGALSLTQDNIGGGLATFSFTQWENTNSYLNPYTFYRARGNSTSPLPVANGDSVSSQGYFCYGDSGNTYVGLGQFYVNAKTNDGAGNVSADIGIFTQNNNDGSSISFTTDDINLYGNVNTPHTITIASGNISLNSNGTIDYLRTYGDFYSNVSQTNPNVANVNLMTFNNTGIADGISIVSNSQMTIARAGNYNIQFSAQLSQTSGGSEEAYIWLRKNGSDVPYTAGETVIAGNGDKIMAAWNYVVTANVNDYFELAWHATDTSVILESVAPTGLVPGIASVIATVTPVGA